MSDTIVQLCSGPECRPPSPSRRTRIVLFNGWLRTYTYPYLWMKPLAEYLEHTYGNKVEIIGNRVPCQSQDIEKYTSLVNDMLASSSRGLPPDTDTFFIGQSVGCQVLMRYIASLPDDVQVGGLVCVGCWLTLDYKTRRRRSAAIDDLIQDRWSEFSRWMDRSTINFVRLRQVTQGNIVALMSDNDPFRGLDDNGQENRRDWESLGANVVLRRGRGHFATGRLQRDDEELIQRLCRLKDNPCGTHTADLGFTADLGLSRL